MKTSIYTLATLVRVEAAKYCAEKCTNLRPYIMYTWDNCGESLSLALYPMDESYETCAYVLITSRESQEWTTEEVMKRLDISRTKLANEKLKEITK